MWSPTTEKEIHSDLNWAWGLAIFAVIGGVICIFSISSLRDEVREQGREIASLGTRLENLRLREEEYIEKVFSITTCQEVAPPTQHATNWIDRKSAPPDSLLRIINGKLYNCAVREEDKGKYHKIQDGKIQPDYDK